MSNVILSADSMIIPIRPRTTCRATSTEHPAAPKARYSTTAVADCLAVALFVAVSIWSLWELGGHVVGLLDSVDSQIAAAAQDFSV